MSHLLKFLFSGAMKLHRNSHQKTWFPALALPCACTKSLSFHISYRSFTKQSMHVHNFLVHLEMRNLEGSR